MPHPHGTNGEAREIIVADTMELLVRLMEFYEPEQAVEWMNSPHPQLENETAANLIAHGHSDKVNRVLLRLEADAYI